MNQKTAVISIIGMPNAGKSSLLNKLINYNLSIITRKPQTTRDVITGIITEGDTQLIFTDTPGMFKSTDSNDRILIKRAWGSIEDVDMVVLVIDSSKRIDDDIFHILASLNQKSIAPIIVLNKVDRADIDKLHNLASHIENEYHIKDLFKISAKTGKNIDQLRKFLQENALPKAFIYDEGEVTTLASSKIAEEATRAQLMLRLGEELPYAINIVTEKFIEKPKKVTIHQTIYVLKESQKVIVIGNNGKIIKEAGIESRKRLKTIFERDVDLFLHVKVDKDWQNKTSS